MGQKKKQTRPQQSFAQMVSKANQEALKPYIEQLVLFHMQNFGNQLAKKFFTQQANIQTRIMAVERVLKNRLNLAPDELRQIILDIEDEATGHKLVNRPAQLGDLLRITMSTKTSTETEFGRETMREILDLGSDSDKNPDTKLLNDSLVGMSAGESKEVDVGGGVTVKLTVNRVSEAPPKPEQAAPAQGE